MALGLDPVASGRRLATFFAGVESRLWADLAETGRVPAARAEAARSEWECLALDACLRGLVAAGGFGERTAEAVDAFHAGVLEQWSGATAPLPPRRERLTARYEEYGALARGLEAAGAARVSATLGAAAAAHACAPEPAPEDLAMFFGAMHEAITEGAAAALAPDAP